MLQQQGGVIGPTGTAMVHCLCARTHAPFVCLDHNFESLGNDLRVPGGCAHEAELCMLSNLCGPCIPDLTVCPPLDPELACILEHPYTLL